MFNEINGVPASVNGLARWDGAILTAMLPGHGFPTVRINAMTVFDDGVGPELYVGGSFDPSTGGPGWNIAAWDGNTWSDLGGGTNGAVRALEVFDDGSGPALYVGGEFTLAGGVAASRIAKWDGSTWSALGAGCDAPVLALAVHDDGWGGGPDLYAGGEFGLAGGMPAKRVARWHGCSQPYPSSYCSSPLTTNGCTPTILGCGAPSASSGSGFEIAATRVESHKQGLIFYGVSGPHFAPWGNGWLCVRAPTQRTPAQDSGGVFGACEGVLSIDFNEYIASNPGAVGQPFAAGDQVWAQA